jgi:hypothetical protein
VEAWQGFFDVLEKFEQVAVVGGLLTHEPPYALLA